MEQRNVSERMAGQWELGFGDLGSSWGSEATNFLVPPDPPDVNDHEFAITTVGLRNEEYI